MLHFISISLLASVPTPIKEINHNYYFISQPPMEHDMTLRLPTCKLLWSFNNNISQNINQNASLILEAATVPLVLISPEAAEGDLAVLPPLLTACTGSSCGLLTVLDSSGGKWSFCK